jgi:predicted O-methyltransferase YrrM
MDPLTWAQVDQYLVETFVSPDPVLGSALEDSARAGMPAISVTPTEGKLLHLLARMLDARRILEIGTLGGYSTIWLARALPAHGQLVTLEIDRGHARVAGASITRAGLGDRVEIRVGRAADSLASLVAEAVEPFDLVFIDADKPSNPEYLGWALRLTHIGSVIVVDNVIRQGRVIDADSDDPAIVATRRMHEMIAADPRLEATAIQTVGTKGHDGMTIALVVA